MAAADTSAPATFAPAAPGAPDSGVSIVVINAGVSEASSTRVLAGLIAQHTVSRLAECGLHSTVSIIELGPIAVDVAQSIVAGVRHQRIEAALEQLALADAVIAATPVYKAAVSGLFKSFVDVVDDDLLAAKPVVLAATGGTARHTMVVDQQLRPLLAYFRSIPVPTSLYATPEECCAPPSALRRRMARAAEELAMLVSGRDDRLASRRRYSVAGEPGRW